MEFVEQVITPPKGIGIKGCIVRCCLAVVAWLLSFGYSFGQNVALRTNLLYDATLSPNIGAEVRVDTVWTAGLNVGFNLWDYDSQKNKKWRHVLLTPYIRRYSVGRDTLRRAWQYRDSVRLPRVTYWEADLLFGHFNVGNVKFPFGMYKDVRDYRLQGDFIALGGKYGCSWPLGRSWRLETEAGLAVGYARYKQYDCATCGKNYGEDDRLFLLPQVGVNLVYLLNLQ